MRCLGMLFGALLLGAAPHPSAGDRQILDLSLTETPDQVTRILGRPALVADFAGDFLSWQYQIGDIDHHEFSHQLVFRRSTRSLISVTRNYDPPRILDDLFPASETTTHHSPDKSFHLRLRRLSGGRLLMAMGAAEAGQQVAQVLLIRQSELAHFYPWLAKQL